MGSAASCSHCHQSDFLSNLTSPVRASRVGPSLYRPARNGVYQQMNRPLSDYYIFGSSSSYLKNPQQFEPSLDALAKCLDLGVRYIELQIHDRKPGWAATVSSWLAPQAVVFHNAYGAAHPLLLCDCLRIIAQLAFVKTDFPLLLLLDDHCSEDGKTRLARTLKEMLGSLLHSDRHVEGPLQTPESLRRKIVLIHHDRLRARRGYQGPPKALAKIVYLSVCEFKLLYTSRFNVSAATVYDEEHWHDAVQRQSALQEHSFKHLVIFKMADATLCPDNKLLTETQAQGVQINAFFIPQWDLQTWMVHSFFSTENGGCGYVLKPDVLCSQTIIGGILSSCPKADVIVRVRSVRLPRVLIPVGSRVSVIVYAFDIASKEARQFETESVPASGALRFQTSFEVKTECAQLASLVFAVKVSVLPDQTDCDGCSPSLRTRFPRSETQIVAHFGLSINNLTAGPGMLPLLDKHCNQIATACLGTDISLKSEEDSRTEAAASSLLSIPETEWASAQKLVHASPMLPKRLPDVIPAQSGRSYAKVVVVKPRRKSGLRLGARANSDFDERERTRPGADDYEGYISRRASEWDSESI